MYPNEVIDVLKVMLVIILIGLSAAFGIAIHDDFFSRPTVVYGEVVDIYQADRPATVDYRATVAIQDTSGQLFPERVWTLELTKTQYYEFDYALGECVKLTAYENTVFEKVPQVEDVYPCGSKGG